MKVQSLLLAVLLCGCATKPVESPVCPSYAIISDLAQLPLAANNQASSYVKIRNLKMVCDDGNTFKLSFGTEAITTTAIKPGDAIVVPYFIAVIDEKETVLDRKDYILKIPAKSFSQTHEGSHFAENNFSISYTVSENFDRKKDRLLVGLALTSEQRQFVAVEKSSKLQQLKQEANIQEIQQKKIKASQDLAH